MLTPWSLPCSCAWKEASSSRHSVIEGKRP
ncbi:BgTH12-01535 [Blumeria graminis f. sp. triticale]|uniref:BgTH12-01535 n=1 Tax=Blumeria graminis f. sp. triticale TaxID=1689686 RepID=A0A9W4CZ79_BLUGR|nr:BgTH12-01535 [Blumeria graminis f. sp. triticale]